MNKQELIEKYKRLEGVWDAPGAETARQIFLQDLDQIDEPQKVVVPQFVADWLKLSKNIGRSLFGAMRVFEKDGDVEKWLQWAENQELFARAWLDGYEVEKEKRYRISMPKARNHKNHAQFLCEQDEKIFWCGEWYPFKTKFTRKELEQDNFGWVLDCPGIEIEEVE